MLKVMKKDFWVKRLPTIVRRGYAKPAELKLASDFHSCAVAEAARQQPLVVKFKDDEPTDGSLSKLGRAFYNQLEDGNVTDAAKTYASIMARTTEMALLRKFKV